MHYPIANEMLFHWLDNTAQLSQRVCVVLIAAHVSIRIDWLRQALRGDSYLWRNRLVCSAFFGIFAMIGTHSGFLLDIHQLGKRIAWPADLSDALKHSQAVIGFRDLMVLAAGITGGPWIGFGAGLAAGGERYLLGGFAGEASAVATLLQGVWAGLAVRWWPILAKRLRGAAFIALIGTLMQKAVLLALVTPMADALALVVETALPVAVVNTFGLLSFLFVMQDLERDRLVNQARQAELRALNAQIEPHFMNNTLNAIKALIRRDPDAAAQYVVKLARFLDDTRTNTGANSISLQQEITQVERYLDFQRLRFPDAFQFQRNISPQLLPCQLPPRCLQTLAENALLHGMQGQNRPLKIDIIGVDHGATLTLRVSDTGCGIADPRLKELGNRPVESAAGNGSGLYQLKRSLKLAFPRQSCLVINSWPGHGTEVVLTIPKRTTTW
ncbi:LytS/YhcK type 5TM receptor domain-containing protein [Methylomonas sp. EFPC3]|uniref:LytS/YhcK type 5TM receptor domain-containing protein n=1 Tax=Methylomonas sp. EFPC3 TaxID=3021710 RepID=UPI0024168E73|nr:LytS/YhcK type 5TM receptor domain-containing protein [Methylomonas sp. EFPC3]WFP49666.1 LytS/YhcK type 5TM receptor domain-containing protein [Methylomonas sp. EFPC3]